jgi:type IV pilus assembly protein PilV
MSRASRRVNGVRSAGCALLEALVALSILAAGLLGSMALLLASLRSSREALYHGTAVRLAGDLAERVRANRAGVSNYAFDSTVAPAVAGPTCSVGVTCPPDERARTDVAEWRQELAAALPQAAARLTLDDSTAVAGPLCTIELSWGGSDRTAGGSYTLRLRTLTD